MNNALRLPVRRRKAESYLLLTLVSFAGTVVITRTYLELTGYPQIGNGNLHIAHVLWGGLALFIAALLMLTFYNHWVFSISAVLSGVGIGLFIDEVGKFITKTNDYFYPPALPIIYAFFLFTVLLYFFMRRRRLLQESNRAGLYKIFDAFQEVLDRDLDSQERADLETQLTQIASSGDTPDLPQLAQALLVFLKSDTLQVIPTQPSPVDRLQDWIQGLWARLIGPKRLKVLLILGLGTVGLLAFLELFFILVALIDPAFLRDFAFDLLIESSIKSNVTLNWFLVRLAAEGIVGLLLLVSSLLLLIGQDRRGSTLGYMGLVIFLTVINLLVFYFDQYSTIVLTLIQATLLVGVLQYRRYYLSDQKKSDQPNRSPLT